MAWTTPRAWVAGEGVDESIMNTHVRDNLIALKTGRIGRLVTDVAPVGNVGVGEDDLITYSLPSSTLVTDGQAVRITAWGVTANNANAKTLKLYFGAMMAGSVALDTSSASNWMVQALVIRTGAATQAALRYYGTHGTTFKGTGGTTTPTETLSGAVTIKCTGDATADDDIQQTLMMVELLE